MAHERILIIEDEPEWIELIQFWLMRAGYDNFQAAETGNTGLEMAKQAPPDCILLDFVLPDQTGMDVCQKLRALPELSRVPVVLFTGHRRDKVLGLQCGADYFVSKSERPHELLATIEAVFRRRETEQGVLRRGVLILRSQDRQVHWDGRHVATLSPKMFTLMHVLAERSPQPVSRPDLYRLVEGREEPGLSRALDVMLNRLRKVLPPEVAAKIVNVKNFGYVYLGEEAAAPVPAAAAEAPPTPPLNPH